jgi:hypothetical protein
MAQEYMLAVHFGMTHGRYNMWCRFGRRVLVKALEKDPLAAPTFPSVAKRQEYNDAITAKYPSLKDIYCMMDGLKIRIQRPGDACTQERYYNGWKSSHFINCLFVFAPDGTIIVAVVDCVGTKHDSEMAMLGSPSVYEVLDRTYEESGGKCSADSAFATAGRFSIVKSVARDNIPMVATSHQERVYLRENLSLRQAAEWGMHAYQGSFPRLKMTLRFEEERGERHVLLWLAVLLYNYRANTV